MNIPKVSVIIPFYNVENYIKACMQRIVNQTLKDIEIIAINDGSTDNSKLIVEKYENIILIDQPNGGASAARNAGLEVAKGKYIYFMDSDDTLELNALELMSDMMEKDNLDMAVMSPDNYLDEYDEPELKRIIERDYTGVMTGKELFRRYVENDYFCSGPPFRMIKHQFIKETEIQFYEGIIYEDELFTFQLLMLCNRVEMLNKQLYHVYVRDDSVTTGTDYERRYISYKVLVDSFAKLTTWRNSTEEELKAINKYLMDRFFGCNDFYYNMEKEKKKKYRQQHKEVFEDAQKCNFFGRKRIFLVCKMHILLLLLTVLFQ